MRGDTVTMRTEWFDLCEARVQLTPFAGCGIEVGGASVYSPTGVTPAGRHGRSVLSVAASDVQARGRLADNWEIHERAATEHGHRPRRDRWRVVGMMHLAESQAIEHVKILIRPDQHTADIGDIAAVAATADQGGRRARP